MFSKINILQIVVDHLDTLKDANTQRISFFDILLFIIAPLSGAVIVVFCFDYLMGEGLVNILIASLSIFVGLLLNLLVIIFDVITKVNGPGISSKLKKDFLKEIYSNISFCILISIVNIGFLVLTLASNPYIKTIGNVIADTLLLVFGITLLMVLKRVHVLLSNEFRAS